MTSRNSLISLLSSSLVLLLVIGSPLVAKDSKALAKAKKGSTLSVKLSKPAPLGKVLAYVEQKTGNKVRAVDAFGRDDKKALAKKIQLKLSKQPFWTVVAAISKATGLTMNKVDKGAVQLQDPSTIHKVGNSVPAGPPFLKGAFRVEPIHETFMKELVLRIHPEPWMPTPVFIGASAVLEKGKVDLRENQSRRDIFSGGLDVKFSLKGKGFKDIPVDSSDKFRVKVKLGVPVEIKEFKSDPLSNYVVKPMAMGNAKLTVSHASTVDGELKVGVIVQGFSDDDAKLNFELVDAAGAEVKRRGSSWFGIQGKHEFDLRFTVPDGDISRAHLIYEKTKIPLRGAHVGKVMDFGLSKVRVASITKSEFGGANSYRVDLRVEGVRLNYEEISIVDKNNKPVAVDGFEETGSDTQHVARHFELPGKMSNYRLVVKTASKMEELEFSKTLTGLKFDE